MKIPFALIKNPVFQFICDKLYEVQKENKRFRQRPNIPEDAVNRILEREETIRIITNEVYFKKDKDMKYMKDAFVKIDGVLRIKREPTTHHKKTPKLSEKVKSDKFP